MYRAVSWPRRPMLGMLQGESDLCSLSVLLIPLVSATFFAYLESLDSRDADVRTVQGQLVSIWFMYCFTSFSAGIQLLSSCTKTTIQQIRASYMAFLPIYMCIYITGEVKQIEDGFSVEIQCPPIHSHGCRA